jgi:magnesium-transporting ATPase (P-type)
LILKDEEMDDIDLASPSDRDENREQFSLRLDSVYRKFIEKKSSISYIPREDKMNAKINFLLNKKLYLIIDGKNLAYVLTDIEMRKKFFRVGMLASSVICCRVSPKQKSEVVKLAKENGTFITLSIGDGANDVPMIMEAHIGIGISGKEGTQAVRSADYAIGQFQFLKRLLLVHGRWGYRRIAYFICYYFYKNIVLVFTEIYFAFYNGFSGQIFFPDLLPLCYNAFWTSWPCIFAYSIERDVDDILSLKYPILYKAGQDKFYFTMKKFWIWILFAVVHGAIVFFGVGQGAKEIMNNEGFLHDHWFYSTLCFSCLIHIVTFKIFVDLMYWNLLSV